MSASYGARAPGAGYNTRPPASAMVGDGYGGGPGSACRSGPSWRCRTSGRRDSTGSYTSRQSATGYSTRGQNSLGRSGTRRCSSYPSRGALKGAGGNSWRTRRIG